MQQNILKSNGLKLSWSCDNHDEMVWKLSDCYFWPVCLQLPDDVGINQHVYISVMSYLDYSLIRLTLHSLMVN